ncbi:T9SS type A sorting domain-containing protein [Hymenobacter sp. BT635]|uniref:T9SS type A sorting domain-containing protein n=1 Tax=Hymenobacter nitidus TaxID=2880929 RepID=A0ABS8AHQ7_9BACT|nr:T9SS type A sorting domain-containing protein [Hymenobacter nitidus]MCB2378519.1 T9SS type A sorting domain-containing protein [Hymenobacter nitidus]
MKKALLIMSLLGLSLASWAQEATSLSQDLQSSLSTLDRNRIKTGVLYDLTLPVSKPEQFTGNGQATNSYANWEQQYAEFYQASLNKTNLPTLSALREQINGKIANGQVPLLVLDYTYDKLLPDAAAQKLITVDSLQARVYDGPDLSRSPYTQGRIFASALPIETYTGSYELYIGPEFYFTNNATKPADLWVDTGAGTGWQQLQMGTAMPAVWNNPEVYSRGTDALTTTTDQQQVTVYSAGAYAVTAVRQARGASMLPDVALGLASSRSWGGYARSRAMGWVKWGAGNTTGKFRKPMVFVEGIDFERKRAGSKCDNYAPATTGPISLSSFQLASCGSGANALTGLGIFRNGEAGWNEMVDYNGEYKALEMLPALRTQLTQQGYDVVFLDFTDGADLIQNNAMVLVELLDYINNPNNRTADAQESVVMGASMGGQVARFALAWMEQQNICHNAKLYVSMDSPHRGANIPIGIQHMFDRLSDVWIGAGSARDVKEKLLRPAARQMLVYHFDDGAAMAYRNEWQAWQSSANSYPSLMRRVAVANGSKQATQQPGMWPGCELLSIDTSFNPALAITGQGYSYALPGASSRGNHNVVFRYQKPYSFNWHYKQVSASTPAYDTAPGSTYRTGGIARDESGIFNNGFESNTFMPTTSVLDVVASGPIGSANLNYNLSTNIPDPTVPNRAKYAFDAYFAPDVNEPHVQITNGTSSGQGNASYYSNNTAWILNELAQSNHALPQSLSTIYNFGNIYRHLLPSVQVNSGGELYINNGYLPVNGGTAATQAAPPVGNFEMYTSNCGTVVQLNSGGIFAVGVNSTYTASLNMATRSLLDLRSGGRVDVNAGSVLRIKSGATLVVRAGSVLNVYGQVIVESGAFLCVENQASIVVASGGQYTVNPGVTSSANPALNLGTLACGTSGPSCSSSSVVLTTTTSNATACAATYRFTASGSNIGTNYQWAIDGYPVPSYNGRTYVEVRLDAYTTEVTVDVSVSSSCSGVLPVTAHKYAMKFVNPKCGGMAREATTAQRISLYPNPSDNYLLVTSKDPARTAVTTEAEAAGAPGKAYDFQAFRVELYDGRGKQVNAQQTQQGELRLDTSKIPNGLYHIKVIQGDEVLQENISIQH